MSNFFNGRVLGSVWKILTGKQSQENPEEHPRNSEEHPRNPEEAPGSEPHWQQSTTWPKIMGEKSFIGRVPRQLQLGDVITISGVIHEDAQKFSINLCCDQHCGYPQNEQNIAYHSKVMFDQNCIVTNYKTDGRWGDEEGPHDNPFEPGREFTMSMHLKDDEIYTYENDNYMHSLQHRIDIGQIQTVQLWHHAKVTALHFKFAD